MAETARERRAFSDGPWLWETLASAYGRSGTQKQGRHAIHELKQLNRHQRIDPAAIARGYVALGDKDRAVMWLEKAYAQHSNVLHILKVEPIFAPVSNDPRFQDLLRRVGLAPNNPLETDGVAKLLTKIFNSRDNEYRTEIIAWVWYRNGTATLGRRRRAGAKCWQQTRYRRMQMRGSSGMRLWNCSEGDHWTCQIGPLAV